MSGSENENFIFSEVINTSRNWGDESNTMYVVGGTKPEFLKALESKYQSIFY